MFGLLTDYVGDYHCSAEQGNSRALNMSMIMCLSWLSAIADEVPKLLLIQNENAKIFDLEHFETILSISAKLKFVNCGK